jgi:hypothetical protein
MVPVLLHTIMRGIFLRPLLKYFPSLKFPEVPRNIASFSNPGAKFILKDLLLQIVFGMYRASEELLKAFLVTRETI